MDTLCLTLGLNSLVPLAEFSKGLAMQSASDVGREPCVKGRPARAGRSTPGALKSLPASESQLPLIQFIKHGQYPTFRQHLNSATQVSCSELWTVGSSVRLENELSSACKRSSWLSGGTHQ